MVVSGANPVAHAASGADSVATHGPVVAFPGPWQFHLLKGAIILVRDQQLDDLTAADKEVDLSLSSTPNRTTLRRLCEQQRAAAARTILLLATWRRDARPQRPRGMAVRSWSHWWSAMSAGAMAMPLPHM